VKFGCHPQPLDCPLRMKNDLPQNSMEIAAANKGGTIPKMMCRKRRGGLWCGACKCNNKLSQAPGKMSHHLFLASQLHNYARSLGYMLTEGVTAISHAKRPGNAITKNSLGLGSISLLGFFIHTANKRHHKHPR